MKMNSIFNSSGKRFEESSILMEFVRMALEKAYAEERAKLVRCGKEAAALRCQYPGGNIPYGFTVDKKTGEYAINEEEAQNVRLVFAMIASGASLDTALWYLGKVGAKTKSGNDFTRSALRKMLRNERYNGVYTYNMHRSGGKQIRIPGGMPRIVEERVFRAVQAMLTH